MRRSYSQGKADLSAGGSRTEEHLFATVPPASSSTVFGRILGNEAVQSETLMAYELGYRAQATERFSWDIATFYNVYGNLVGSVVIPPTYVENDPPPPHTVLPIVIANTASADTYGAELSTNWTATEHWRLASNYTFLRMITQGTPGQANDPGKNPCHQVSLRSSWDLREDLDFDLTARYVDCLSSLGGPQLHHDGLAIGMASAKAPGVGRGRPEPLAGLPLRVRPDDGNVG